MAITSIRAPSRYPPRRFFVGCQGPVLPVLSRLGRRLQKMCWTTGRGLVIQTPPPPPPLAPAPQNALHHLSVEGFFESLRGVEVEWKWNGMEARLGLDADSNATANSNVAHLTRSWNANWSDWDWTTGPPTHRRRSWVRDSDNTTYVRYGAGRPPRNHGRPSQAGRRRERGGLERELERKPHPPALRMGGRWNFDKTYLPLAKVRRAPRTPTAGRDSAARPTAHPSTRRLSVSASGIKKIETETLRSRRLTGRDAEGVASSRIESAVHDCTVKLRVWTARPRPRWTLGDLRKRLGASAQRRARWAAYLTTISLTPRLSLRYLAWRIYNYESRDSEGVGSS
ncbi:hypothetical protein B0H11DRAFT_1935793 [Mycena galericulata]|nr:hypothetical protein B0H11DRAFT_1935793 [Mycena galericulata]